MLGPILFLLYINDLPENIHSQVCLFADDMAVYLALGKQDVVPGSSKAEPASEWEKLWDMEFNPSKCMVMHTTRARHPTKSEYIMHNQVSETVDTARYLGVDISSNLNFSTHINRITSNANKTLGFLKRNIRVRNQNVHEAAYQTLMRPQVEYASTVWNPYTKQGNS